jgi:AcrR family transcriptional regulator
MPWQSNLERKPRRSAADAAFSATDPERIGAPARLPRQERSLASYERMLDAAEALLRERGAEDFTLEEVKRLGRVSIGSNYLRFDSKDALIRAVQKRVLAALENRQHAAIALASAEAELSALVPRLIDAVAEPLRDAAPIMRPIMLRAFHDPSLAIAGRASYGRIEAAVVEAVLCHRDALSHPDPVKAARTMFRIVYAAIARFLGFGSLGGARDDVPEWHDLKEEASLMCTAYLLVRSATRRAWSDRPQG